MTHKPTIEIRILASPTKEFALMTSVLYQSLVAYSNLENFKLVVFIGASRSEQDAASIFAKWLEPNIQSVIIDPDAFESQGIHATAARRIEEKSSADLIICMDADMVVCGDINDITLQILQSRAVAGVIAHIQPLTHSDWTLLYKNAQLDAPSFPYRYTAWPYMWPSDMLHRDAMRAPPYFNYGFVAIPAELHTTVTTNHKEARQVVASLFPESYFGAQIALTLAIEKAKAPHSAIGIRYNFPNDYMLEALHPNELTEARIIHLLRRNELFDKHETFKDLDSLRSFIDNEWRTAGALEYARRIIKKIFPEIEANPIPTGLAPTHWLW